jgi:Rps23 Pro-64 3,4-dihydroxylase Tpa1-like proline 4-hydroxylase
MLLALFCILLGIADLIPDPHFRGSGVHQTLPGGYLSVHADFNRYEKYDMHRRVNAFIFLNPNWQDSYGGHLELWSRNLRVCGAKIRPDFGRFVVFSSTDFSYHGHPSPLTCPTDRSRRSLALYYYTRTRPKTECMYNNCNSAHSTLFQTPACSSCSDERCRPIVK